jgi:hypothetical protein
MNINIVICLKEDYGRAGAIDGAKLHEYIKTTTPEEFLKTAFNVEENTTPEDETGNDKKGVSPGSMLVDFLLRYATHSFHSKEEVRRLMNETRVKVTDENGEESAAHVCFLDMMSKSDVAFCLWQYMNSEGDWTHKVLNRNKAGVNHSCRTKWTSDKSGVGKPVSDEGMAVYKELYAWCSELKNLKDTRDYHLFRLGLNAGAREMGLLKGYSKETMIRKRKADEVGALNEDEEEVAVFDDDEFVQMVEV